MAESKSRSGFMTLSAELRNCIYDLCLSPGDYYDGGVDCGIYDENPLGICVQCHSQYAGSDLEDRLWGEATVWRAQPAITQISRQVRQETLPIYYGVNEFIAYGEDDPETVVKWLKSIGKINAGLVKHFSFYGSYKTGGAAYAGGKLAKKLGRYGLRASSVRLYTEEKMVWDGPGGAVYPADVRKWKRNCNRE